MDDLNETPMVFKCSEYSWTTAGREVSSLAVFDSPVSDSDSIRSWDMKVVDVSAPSHWESDFSTLSVTCNNEETTFVRNGNNVASETESWDSHATYKSHRRRHFKSASQPHLPDLLRKCSFTKLREGYSDPVANHKRKHMSKLARKAAEVQRAQELSKKSKQSEHSLLIPGGRPTDKNQDALVAESDVKEGRSHTATSNADEALKRCVENQKT